MKTTEIASAKVKKKQRSKKQYPSKRNRKGGKKQ